MFFRKVQSEKCLSTFCEIISKTDPPWTPASELHFLSPSRRWEPIPTPPLPCSSRGTPGSERKKNIEMENEMYMSDENGEHLVRPWLSSDLYIMPVVRGLWQSLHVVAFHYSFTSWTGHKQKSFRFVKSLEKFHEEVKWTWRWCWPWWRWRCLWWWSGSWRWRMRCTWPWRRRRRRCHSWRWRWRCWRWWKRGWWRLCLFCRSLLL